MLEHVAFEIPRIFFKILVWPELGRIDEDAGHQNIVLASRPLNKKEVAVMQRTHGRYKPDRPALGQQPSRCLLHNTRSPNDFHKILYTSFLRIINLDTGHTVFTRNVQYSRTLHNEIPFMLKHKRRLNS